MDCSKRVSSLRGYPIVYNDGEWFYQDTGESTIETWEKRPCGFCKRFDTKEGYDACLGELPGVINACCGHGEPEHSYVMFSNGLTIRGFTIDNPK